MTLGSLGVLSFVTPWILVGLIVLPVIWWLLRLTPPNPSRVAFPPTRLLLDVKLTEKTPIHTPWWLTLLRLLVGAAIIIALAGPVLKPHARVATFTSPLLVVVDNGWASAHSWASRRKAAEQIATLAEEAGQTIYLVATAGATHPLQPLSPSEFRQKFFMLSPESYPGDRSLTAKNLEQAFASGNHILRVIWLADGLEDDGAAALRRTLEQLSGQNQIEVFTDEPGQGPLGVFLATTDLGSTQIRARVLKGDSASRQGSVAAVTTRGDRLAIAPFNIPSHQSSQDVTLELPLDLRNQIARIEIVNENSSGAVFLTDSRSQRRRVGIVGSEEAEDAQPLLSPSHYLEKGLLPFSNVILARTGNLDQATQDLLSRMPSVIILSDVGRLSGPANERLKSFVEKGGTLIRFAGPRLEQGGDGLLPMPLREGGRTLGGAMTWTSPQKPAPFERGSLFESLAVSPDVTIARQVLGDPARMPRDIKVWARLTDGTPLVTAAQRGRGQIVFFHITANSDWSNLPLSGLFPEMLRKIVEAAPLYADQSEASATESTASAQSRSNAPDGILKAWRLLNGYGVLTEPSDKAYAIKVDNLRNQASPTSPAGLYGQLNATVALNVVSEDTRLNPLILPKGAATTSFAEATIQNFTPWFYLGALCIFLLEGILSAFALGYRRTSIFKPALPALCITLLVTISSVTSPADAQPRRAEPSAEANTFALQASLDTRIAYVLTGNAEVDRISEAGITGLNRVLSGRTAVEPGSPMGVDPSRDELVFFPLIYWPVLNGAEPLPDKVLSKIDAYMRQGGMIVFDTKNDESFTGSLNGSGQTPLATLLGKLDLPPLQRIPEDHVLTKAFYLLQSFPGRWDNGDVWVEARNDTSNRGLKSDGVSSIIVTSNDLASAWAVDANGQPLFPTVPGGEEQREMSYRVGVNIVMYALTGNYKADQVHIPAILERLGH